MEIKRNILKIREQIISDMSTEEVESFQSWMLTITCTQLTICWGDRSKRRPVFMATWDSMVAVDEKAQQDLLGYIIQ
jgi:hypothetical protein